MNSGGGFKLNILKNIIDILTKEQYTESDTQKITRDNMVNCIFYDESRLGRDEQEKLISIFDNNADENSTMGLQQMKTFIDKVDEQDENKDGTLTEEEFNKSSTGINWSSIVLFLQIIETRLATIFNSKNYIEDLSQRYDISNSTANNTNIEYNPSINSLDDIILRNSSSQNNFLNNTNLQNRDTEIQNNYENNSQNEIQLILLDNDNHMNDFRYGNNITITSIDALAKVLNVEKIESWEKLAELLLKKEGINEPEEDLILARSAWLRGTNSGINVPQDNINIKVSQNWQTRNIDRIKRESVVPILQQIHDILDDEHSFTSVGHILALFRNNTINENNIVDILYTYQQNSQYHVNTHSSLLADILSENNAFNEKKEIMQYVKDLLVKCLKNNVQDESKYADLIWHFEKTFEYYDDIVNGECTIDRKGESSYNLAELESAIDSMVASILTANMDTSEIDVLDVATGAMVSDLNSQKEVINSFIRTLEENYNFLTQPAKYAVPNQGYWGCAVGDLGSEDFKAILRANLDNINYLKQLAEKGDYEGFCDFYKTCFHKAFDPKIYIRMNEIEAQINAQQTLDVLQKALRLVNNPSFNIKDAGHINALNLPQEITDLVISAEDKQILKNAIEQAMTVYRSICDSSKSLEELTREYSQLSKASPVIVQEKMVNGFIQNHEQTLQMTELFGDILVIALTDGLATGLVGAAATTSKCARTISVLNKMVNTSPYTAIVKKTLTSALITYGNHRITYGQNHEQALGAAESMALFGVIGATNNIISRTLLSKLSSEALQKAGVRLMSMGMDFGAMELMSIAAGEEPDVAKDLTTFVAIVAFGHLVNSYNKNPKLTDDEVEILKDWCVGFECKFKPNDIAGTMTDLQKAMLKTMSKKTIAKMQTLANNVKAYIKSIKIPRFKTKQQTDNSGTQNQNKCVEAILLGDKNKCDAFFKDEFIYVFEDGKVCTMRKYNRNGTLIETNEMTRVEAKDFKKSCSKKTYEYTSDKQNIKEITEVDENTKTIKVIDVQNGEIINEEIIQTKTETFEGINNTKIITTKSADGNVIKCEAFPPKGKNGLETVYELSTDGKKTVKSKTVTTKDGLVIISINKGDGSIVPSRIKLQNGTQIKVEYDAANEQVKLNSDNFVKENNTDMWDAIIEQLGVSKDNIDIMNRHGGISEIVFPSNGTGQPEFISNISGKINLFGLEVDLGNQNMNIKLSLRGKALYNLSSLSEVDTNIVLQKIREHLVKDNADMNVLNIVDKIIETNTKAKGLTISHAIVMIKDVLTRIQMGESILSVKNLKTSNPNLHKTIQSVFERFQTDFGKNIKYNFEDIYYVEEIGSGTKYINLLDPNGEVIGSMRFDEQNQIKSVNVYEPTRSGNNRALKTYMVKDGVIGSEEVKLPSSGNGNGNDTAPTLLVEDTGIKTDISMSSTYFFNMLNNNNVSSLYSEYNDVVAPFRENVRQKYIELSNVPAGNRIKTLSEFITGEIAKSPELQTIFKQLCSENSRKFTVLNFGVSKKGEIYFGVNKISADHIAKGQELIGERNAMFGRENDYHSQCAEIALKAQAGEELDGCDVYDLKIRIDKTNTLIAEYYPPCTACRERVRFYGWTDPDPR